MSIEINLKNCYSLTEFSRKYGLKEYSARKFVLNRFSPLEGYINLHQYNGGYLIEELKEFPEELLAILRNRKLKGLKK